MTETIKQISRVIIKAPIQEVWDTLLRQGEPLPFFFGNVMHTTGLVPGGLIHMRSPDGKYTGVIGEILEIDPPNRYSMTFQFTTYDDPPCKVTHELKEVEGGVEYTLTSSEIPAGSKTERDMKQGGALIVNTLKSLVETGKIPMKTRFVLTMISLTAWMTPKRCLAENWPMQ